MIITTLLITRGPVSMARSACDALCLQHVHIFFTPWCVRCILSWIFRRRALHTFALHTFPYIRLPSHVGHTAAKFKTRYNGHTSSFRNSKYKHAMELSFQLQNSRWKQNKVAEIFSIAWCRYPFCFLVLP